MPKQKNKIIQNIQKFWTKVQAQTVPLMYSSFYRFVYKQYKLGREDALTEAIEFFNKYKDEPMTGNVVNLELKAMRGDFKK